MRELSLIITSKVLDKDLLNGVYYFKLNFSKIFQNSYPVPEIEFIEGITNSFENFKSDWKTIREKLESSGFEIELTDDIEVWQNPAKDIVITQRGIIKRSDDVDINSLIRDIKKDVLNDNIFLKVEFYI